MMQIYVNGKMLDLYDNEMSIHFENFRFATLLQDDYSTDIKMPRSRTNDSVFAAYGILDRNAQLFGERIPCMAVYGDTTSDGYLTITAITDIDITATMYFSIVSVEVLGSKLRDVVPDDDESIFSWTKWNSYYIGESGFGFPYYDYGAVLNEKHANLHPSVRINSLLTKIGSSLGVTMPTVSTDLAMLAAKKLVCPQNNIQCIGVTAILSDGYVTDAGQHVCNDLEGFSGQSTLTDDSIKKITFNRSCSVAIRLTWGYASYQYQSSYLIVKKNGTAIMSCAPGQQIAVNGYSYHEGSTTCVDGDIITFEASSGGSIHAIVTFDITDYEIKDDDYDIDLVYCAERPTLNTQDAQMVDHSYTFPEIHPSYSFIGTICNFTDMTVRELLSSLCWYLQKGLAHCGDTMSFVDIKSKEIDARIESMEPTFDKLGKVTTVKYKGANPSATKVFDCYTLDDEVVLHESIFAAMVEGPNAEGATVGRIFQYYNLSLSLGLSFYSYVYSFDGVPLGVISERSVPVLTPPSDLTLMGVEDLHGVLLVEGSTYDDIRGYDYVYIDGHKYMVVEGDMDIETNLTTFKALLV